MFMLVSPEGLFKLKRWVWCSGGGTVRLGIRKKNATERKVISSHRKNHGLWTVK
jgi:hypothetical protein